MAVVADIGLIIWNLLFRANLLQKRATGNLHMQSNRLRRSAAVSNVYTDRKVACSLVAFAVKSSHIGVLFYITRTETYILTSTEVYGTDRLSGTHA